MAAIGGFDGFGQRIQLVGGVAFACCDGLLASPELGSLRCLTATDLDVPPEDARKTHLEVLNAGLLSELYLVLDDALGAMPAQLVQLSQLGVVFGSKHRPFFCLHRGPFYQRALQPFLELFDAIG